MCNACDIRALKLKIHGAEYIDMHTCIHIYVFEYLEIYHSTKRSRIMYIYMLFIYTFNVFTTISNGFGRTTQV